MRGKKQPAELVQISSLITCFSTGNFTREQKILFLNKLQVNENRPWCAVSAGQCLFTCCYCLKRFTRLVPWSKMSGMLFNLLSTLHLCHKICRNIQTAWNGLLQGTIRNSYNATLVKYNTNGDIIVCCSSIVAPYYHIIFI